jgi:hypothetical protein
MTPQGALIELLMRLGAGQGGAVYVTEEELGQWPTAATAALKSQKLISKARPAKSAICPGCERDCVMPVHTPPAPAGVAMGFIVCDKRSDINRVPVPIEKLNQWQCSIDAVSGFIAVCLGLRATEQQAGGAGLWNIGIAAGVQRSQMLCLQAEGVLNLVAGSNALPLADFVGFDGAAYSLDAAMIRQLVDASTTADSRYTPSVARRETRKSETQAVYVRWQNAYLALKRKHRVKSDTWCAQQIAKTDNPDGRSVDTIRKRMKK